MMPEHMAPPAGDRRSVRVRLTPSPANSPDADVDWAGWALFGLIATAALTAVMITAQLAGLTRLDLPLLLGALVTDDPDRARVAGFCLASTASPSSVALSAAPKPAASGSPP